MTGAAFMGSLVQGALSRVDIRIATSTTVELAVTQILGGNLTVMPWGSHPSVPYPPSNGIAIVARGRDRAGLRFCVAVARLLPRELRGPISLMGAREAPWRTRTAIPKALRDDILIVPDTGPASWQRVLADAAIVLLGTPGDVDGPVAAQAMADGRVIVAPRSAEADVRLEEGRDGVMLAPFVREPWAEAIGELLADHDRRTAIGHQAVAVSTSWDEIAEALEEAYTAALGRHERGTAPSEARVVADLRIRPAAGDDPARLAAACWDAGLDVVAIASPDGVDVAGAVASAAPAELTVIRGQEIATADGTIVGLFLGQDVPAGRGFPETADLIHAQGGIVLIPHPATTATPPPALLHAHAARVDCIELANPAGGPAQRPVLRAARDLGLVISAGSGAASPTGLGAVAVEMRPFGDGRDFLEALAESELIRPRRRRARRSRGTRRTS